MKIGLYHGYELNGSGSNEYTRYLARSFVQAGHEVHVICREYKPETIPFISTLKIWQEDGTSQVSYRRNLDTSPCIVHQLPYGEVYPVYLTDKQRQGNVKSFISLNEDELDYYHRLNENLLTAILKESRLDVLHANHLVYQPIAALHACEVTKTPLVIFPHGSSIEYTIRSDVRYKQLALKSLLGCNGLITGNREVRDRILNLYPENREAILAKTKIVGVGVDTSLFKPVERENRLASIRKLQATQGGGGKTSELSRELLVRLKNEKVEVTREYNDRYDHAKPDDDLNAHLDRIPWQENTLLFVGALTVGKGLQSVIVALPKILQTHPKTHLIIVGSGAYREVLEALVHAIATSNRQLLLQLCEHGKDLDRNELTGPWDDVQQFFEEPGNLDFTLENGASLAEHVHFLGRLDHSRLQYLFPCADLALFPSVVPEAYPLVLMESLANGVLPLVSYFSGFKDGVDELVPFLGESLTDMIKLPVDPEIRIRDIAENISSLLAGSTFKTIGSKLREIATENYDWQLRATQMVEAYQAFVR